MKKKLRKIFNYYKKKYNIICKLTYKDFVGFKEGEHPAYYDFFNTIICVNLNLMKKNKELFSSYKKEFKCIKSIKHFLIFALLHEIFHALTLSPLYFQGFVKNNYLSEAGANSFAETEIKKWI